MSLAAVMLVAAGNLACTATNLEAGLSHTCATLPDKSLRCWGLNANGALGMEDAIDRGNFPGSISLLRPVPVEDVVGDRSVYQVSLGDEFSCVVVGRVSQEVRCWGSNVQGVLGFGDTANRGDNSGEMGAALLPVPLPMSCGAVTQLAVCYRHSCVLCTDNTTIYCLGANANGELGVEDKVNRGDSPGWAGAWSPTDIGGMKIAKLLRGNSASHTCVVTELGMMKCWGANNFGQCGYGILSGNIGDEPGEVGSSLPFIDLQGRKVRDGCLGSQFTCAVYTTDEIECWGFGILGTTANKDKPTGTPMNMSTALKGEGVGMVACGKRHVCALSVTGSHLGCWGQNQFGQLGYDDKNSRGLHPRGLNVLPPVKVGNATMQSQRILSVTAGEQHTCVRFEGNTLMCWGYGKEGQLGSDDSMSIGGSTGDMESLVPVRFDCTGAPSLPPSLSPSTTAPSGSPSLQPTVSPSHTPSAVPSITPSVSSPPSSAPTVPPSTLPSVAPILTPSAPPSLHPSLGPSTTTPSVSPTLTPLAPSAPPSSSPSVSPPSTVPSTAVSASPSPAPTDTPTQTPTGGATPSTAPSVSPSLQPTVSPSHTPAVPSITPSVSVSPPSSPPSVSPSVAPTASPFGAPSSPKPSASPSIEPVVPPSAPPTLSPSQSPQVPPSVAPILTPSAPPSLHPSLGPSTTTPSVSPTLTPLAPSA
eukprot:Hpha_TRINITY_DN16093_c3_g5::TRINITY_DN16093_c3_g5_i1::g.117003::m.117003